MNAIGGTGDAWGTRTRTWLINPFHYIAGGEAMAVGMAILVIASMAAMASRTHLDGVLDFHPSVTVQVPRWVYWVEGPVDWLSASALLLAIGKLLSRSRVRPIDVFGTQALARAPYGLMAVVFCIPGVGAATDRVTTSLMNHSMGDRYFVSVSVIDSAVFLATSVLVLAMLVWMIALMYRAFAVSCNVKGGRAIAAFIVGLLCAEIVSKLVLSAVYVGAGLQ